MEFKVEQLRLQVEFEEQEEPLIQGTWFILEQV
jgi:hypothetical protein